MSLLRISADSPIWSELSETKRILFDTERIRSRRVFFPPLLLIYDEK